MTTTLRSKIDAQLGWTWRDRVGPFVITDDNRLLFNRELADGVGAAQADIVWHAAGQTLAAGQSTTLDLASLGQTLFGDMIVLSLVRVKAILIVNRNTSGSAYLLVGGAESDPWCAPFGMLGDTVKVMAASPLLLANVLDGWDVEFGHEMLKLEAVGGSVTFDIAILGTSHVGSDDSSSSGVTASSSGV